MQENESRAQETIRRFHNKLENDNISIVDGIDYEAYFNEWLRVMKQPNLIIYCNSEQLKEYLDLIYKHDLSFKLLVLRKVNPVPYKQAYANDVEYCFYVYDSKKPFKNYTDEKDSQVFDYVIGNSRPDNVAWHPTTKPLEHAKLLVNKHTKKGDLVLDTFMGSGTTGVACKMLGRDFIGMELDETFYKRATNRINEAKEEITFDF